jgi:hypothetical protein
MDAAIAARKEAADAVYAAKGAVLHAEGQLQDAEAAKRLLDAEAPAAAPKPGDILPLRSDVEGQIAHTEGELAAARAALQSFQAAVHAAAQAAATTTKAAEAHQKVLAWIAMTEDLAPSGIVGELLSNALTPLNDAMRELAGKFKWPTPRVHEDMHISIDGRAYGLWAESMRWRADTLIAIAVAQHSNLRFVVLDRFDVLEVGARGAAMGALYALTCGEAAPLNTCILIGTLKAPPKSPPDVKVTWLGDSALKVAA